MKILDQNGNELTFDSVNFDKGYLVEESIFVTHHEAIEPVQEEGHWETIAEYSNGGKDVDWIIDIHAVEAVDAWDEYEDIHRYIEYTEAELEERRKAEEEAYKNSPEYRIKELESLMNIFLGVEE